MHNTHGPTVARWRHVPQGRARKGDTSNMMWPSTLKKPFGAAALSFVFPGLGQIAAGDRSGSAA